MVTIWNTTVWAYLEGCPIHPTRVDSSLVFAIRQTGNRFVNPILSNWQESFSGSRFARDWENIVDLDFEGGLKMSIRVDLIEWTRIVRIDWSLWLRFKNEEGSCIVISRILTSGGLCGLKMLSIRHAGSRFERRDSVQIELRRNVRIESNRKVPQKNRLSLSVLDMDVCGHSVM